MVFDLKVVNLHKPFSVQHSRQFTRVLLTEVRVVYGYIKDRETLKSQLIAVGTHGNKEHQNLEFVMPVFKAQTEILSHKNMPTTGFMKLLNRKKLIA